MSNRRAIVAKEESSDLDHFEATENPWLAILGMHRSGTSAITQTCVALGMASPPGSLLPPDEFNPRGYGESLELIEINDLLLRRARSTSSAPPLDEGAMTDVDGADLVVALEELTKSGASPWAWKDPRLCLTLPFWRRSIPPKAAIYVWRHPLLVVDSLRRREAMPKSLALALWHRYNLGALESATNLPVFVLSIVRAVSHPLATAQDLSDFLQSQFPGRDVASPRDAALTLEPGLIDTKEPTTRVNSHIQAVIESLKALEGRHEAFAPPALPSLDETERDLIDAHRMAEIPRFDMQKYLEDRRIQTVIDSVLGPRDIIRADRLKRSLRRLPGIRQLGRRIFPGF